MEQNAMKKAGPAGPSDITRRLTLFQQTELVTVVRIVKEQDKLIGNQPG